MNYKNHIALALLLLITVSLPINADETTDIVANTVGVATQNHVLDDLAGIANNLGEFTVMSAKALLWCGQKGLSGAHKVTCFMKDHPVVACTLGLSAYVAWRLIKHRYANRGTYCTLSPAPQHHKYYCCPTCGVVMGDTYYAM